MNGEALMDKETDNIKGYIDHFLYKNEENGYGVAAVITDDDEVVCTGTFKDADVGDTLNIKGSFVNHPSYGMQFKMTSFEVTVPDDAASMQRYLGSGAIRGIGEALAARIVKMFGDNTFRIIEDEPERLAEVKGISINKARDIGIQMAEKREMRDAMIFLQQYGISNNLAVKIFNKYGSRIYSILKENPYKLADDISGVGFKTADEIAAKVGIRVDSEYRIRSGILYALLQASLDGNTYLPWKLLIQKTVELLSGGPEKVDEDLIDLQIGNLIVENRLVCKNDDHVYASSYFYEEQGCAVMLEALNIAEKISEDERSRYLDRIYEIENKRGIELDDLQREAVIKSISNGILIITGGPGTGKTTTINTIINYYAQEGMDIMLAAPTGRAAKRMTEATGYEARTIHRLLEVSGQISEDDDSRSGGVHFERNRDNPLEVDAIIIDEMSMVDIHLFYALLKAIVPGTHLILVGDSSQLPSVGPGQVLSDLIGSGRFPTIVLKKIFRQAEESDIVMNAHRIHNGEKPVFNNKGSKDFFFLERNDSDVICNNMVLLVREKLPPYVKAKPYDIQVLTPMRKGPLGAIWLNHVLQDQLNPADSTKKEHEYGEMRFREGDKVMQIKNNYQAVWEVRGKNGYVVDSGTGIFNGDMGIVKEINEYSQDIIVEFDENRQVRYPFADLDELELSYAITIHKSQGSEYPAVIMPLLGGPRMLMNRNLLYTGVTRARSTVCILGSSQTLFEMVDNEEQLKRFTGLKDRIEEVFDVSATE